MPPHQDTDSALARPALPTAAIAYVLTRPLGASFADWVGRARSLSGLGLCQGEVSLALTTLIVILVGYLTVTHKDVKVEHGSLDRTRAD